MGHNASERLLRSALGRPRPPNGRFSIKLVIETGPGPAWAGRGLQMVVFLITLVIETGWLSPISGWPRYELNRSQMS